MVEYSLSSSYDGGADTINVGGSGGAGGDTGVVSEESGFGGARVVTHVSEVESSR